MAACLTDSPVLRAASVTGGWAYGLFSLKRDNMRPILLLYRHLRIGLPIAARTNRRRGLGNALPSTMPTVGTPQNASCDDLRWNSP